MKKNKKFEYIIVGNSIAGISAIEAIRRNDSHGSIAVVDRDPRHVYSRPLISYYLEGRVSVQGMRLRPGRFYRSMEATPFLGDKAVHLNPEKKAIRLRTAGTLRFRKLLLATGAAPVKPAIEGLEGPGIFTFAGMDDALRIKKAIRKNAQIMVVGAGLIGIKAAEALTALKARVTLVEMADRPLPAVLDVEAGNIVATQLRRKGITLILNEKIRAIKRKGNTPVSALPGNGEEIAIDGAVIAVGMKPRMSLCEGTEIRRKRGIIVDCRMHTSLPDIFAAGDVTESPAFSGGRENTQIWPRAYEQGRVAGTVMAGNDVEWKPGFPMNAVEIFGLPVITLGESSGGDEDAETIMVREGMGYRKIVVSDGRITGAIFVNDIERAGIIAGLMRDRVDVAGFKDELSRKGFGYIYVPRDYRAKHIAPLVV